MGTIRVLIVDDHDIVREGLRSLLAANEDMTVVGEAGNGLEALAMVRALKPDVALMDIAMPEMDGLEATRRLRRDHPQTRVVVLTQHTSKAYVFRILKAGASGYILKRTAGTRLATAIREVYRGNAVLDPAVTEMVVERSLENTTDDANEASFDSLSDREREVLKLVAEGHSSQEIANLLVISVNTVLGHRSALMRKLAIHSRAELVKYAIRLGLTEIGE